MQSTMVSFCWNCFREVLIQPYDHFGGCGAVEVYFILQRGVSVIFLPTFIDLNSMDKLIETPVSVMRYETTAEKLLD